MTSNRPSYDIGVITDLEPSGKIAVMISNGLDSKVLLELLRKIHDDITTINLIRPTGRDVVPDADISLELLDGDGEYQRVCRTILEEIIPYYNQVWCGENAIPNVDWFRNHKDVPNRCTERIEGNYYSPFLFLDKGSIVQLANLYNIDISKTISCIEHIDSHCEECWFCREREYGFAVNNLEVVW